MLSGGLKHSFHAQEIYQLEPWVNSFGQRQTPANVRRAGERHKIIRQIDFGSGVDAGASSGGPLSPDLTFAHQAFSSWPLPWVRFSTLAPNTGVHRNLLLHPVPNGTSLGDKKKKGVVVRILWWLDFYPLHDMKVEHLSLSEISLDQHLQGVRQTSPTCLSFGQDDILLARRSRFHTLRGVVL